MKIYLQSSSEPFGWCLAAAEVPYLRNKLLQPKTVSSEFYLWAFPWHLV